MKKILIMGLPGAGKTFMAEALKKRLEASTDIPLEKLANCEEIGRAHV